MFKEYFSSFALSPRLSQKLFFYFRRWLSCKKSPKEWEPSFQANWPSCVRSTPLFYSPPKAYQNVFWIQFISGASALQTSWLIEAETFHPLFRRVKSSLLLNWRKQERDWISVRWSWAVCLGPMAKEWVILKTFGWGLALGGSGKMKLLHGWKVKSFLISKTGIDSNSILPFKIREYQYTWRHHRLFSSFLFCNCYLNMYLTSEPAF